MGIVSRPDPSAWAPFRIAPAFSERVWGYRDLRPWYDRVAEGEPLGEAWFTGDHCLAMSGAHAGQTLEALFAAEAGAQVACGLKPGVPLDAVKAGIEANTLESSLNVLDMAVGDLVSVAAGAGLAAVELLKGGIAAVPAATPEFVVEDLGGLELMRITPRWPEAKP